MEETIDNKYYKFTPSIISDFSKISKKDMIFENDIYQKFNATTETFGELIICNDTTRMIKKSINFTGETYSEYLSSLEKRDPKKDVWIYNIINGISEQESILYRDEKCIVIPSYTWNSLDISNLHILCLPIDTNLRTIRSLDASHISLLEHMKYVSLKIIKEKYGLDEISMKKFFHYPPSTYHLHIHFVNNLLKFGSSVEYSHELNSVIFNLSIYSDYYKKIVLNKKI
jgi:m7GpppX diphosphatase